MGTEEAPFIEGKMATDKAGGPDGANGENVPAAYQMEIDDGNGDENKERGNWSGQLDFLLSALGYAVGLGNVWRFPYLCYRNGGGAFLIPYAIMLVFVGMPIFFFELALGQYTSLGPMGAFSYSPFFQGIGITMVIISAMVCVYYNMIIAWSIHYLFSSFTSELPWATCDNDWNTDMCYYRLPNTRCDEQAMLTSCTGDSGDLTVTMEGYRANLTDGTCLKGMWNLTYTGAATTAVCGAADVAGSIMGSAVNVTEDLLACASRNGSEAVISMLYSGATLACDVTDEMRSGIINASLAKEVAEIVRQFPSKEYFKNRVLDSSDHIGVLGETKWELVLALLAAWIIVYFSLIKGVKSSGKVVYFTALFPYLVLVILFFNGVLLDGAGDGIWFYINPNFTKLQEPQVWKDATSQIFFSLSASWGGLITLASYNRFNNNLLRDTLIVTMGNCLTSFFAGFVIFSYLGNMAKSLDVLPGEVADQGAGLAFVVYPHAVLGLPAPTFWAIIFFIMLLTLGLDSQFTLLETVVTSIYDKFPKLRKYKYIVLGILCFVMFLLGLPLCTQAGENILTLIDSTAGGWNIMIIGILECVSISVVYGWYNFSEDINLMLGVRPTPWWRLNWTIITPLILVFVLIFSWAQYDGFSNGSYEFPEWANGIGWLITLSTLIPIVVYMVITVVSNDGDGIFEKFKIAMTRSENWGPALTKHRAQVQHLQNFKIDISSGSGFGSSGDNWNKNNA